MTATTINFVRHGKVYNPNHVLYERLPGFHLSTSGRRMAETTGRYIAASPQLNTATAVYSSPLDRTRETADAILIELNALRAERGQEQLELLGETDTTGLPVWRRDEHLDLTGLPVWAPD